MAEPVTYLSGGGGEGQKLMSVDCLQWAQGMTTTFGILSTIMCGKRVVCI